MSLPPQEASVGAARGLVTGALAEWAADDLTDDATLLVSELATNAVVHAGTDFDVSVELLGDTVEVAVTDRHPTRTLPAPPASVDGDFESGRGLFLTAALAEKWGVDYTSTTKRVWFRLPLAGGAVPSPRTAAPAAGSAEDDGPVPGVGSVRLDADGVVGWVDATAAALLGRTSDELVGRTWLTLCDPAEAATVVAASAVTRWQGSYPVVLPDGEGRRLQVRHVRLAADPDGAPGTALVLVDHRLRALIADVASSATAPAPSTAAPAGPFAHSPESLVRLELDELLDRTVAWARDVVGGDGAFALLVSGDDDMLELRAATGLRPDVDRVPRRAGEGISGRVSRDLMPVVHDDLADVLEGPEGGRSAEPWLLAAGVRSLVAVPVLAEGRLIGTVGVTAARPSAFAVADGVNLQRGVDAVALALQSARVTEIERRRHGWLGYLAEAGELLAGTLDPDMALALVAQLVTPRLGPWCAIYLVDESGRSTRATEWHADEDRLDDLRAYLDAVPPPEPPGAGVTRWLPGSLERLAGRPARAGQADRRRTRGVGRPHRRAGRAWSSARHAGARARDGQRRTAAARSCTCWPTSRRVLPWRWTTPGSTPSGPRPAARCSAACCPPSCPSCPGWRWASSTRRPARATRWAVTSTTSSRSRTTPVRPSPSPLATSAARAPRRRR